ncbi:MAG TPA: 30S ribosomal protein S14, partial [Candidatus Thorarchaeota archaeon]|nr:MAG: 30S ribosomal protein S14 [Candidatus Thorarchaeota archaeon]RLI61471.1 MAG: 30S ribosomal protein S14 [Candidatus Thorarchaeota archaeon]HDD67623.1 30S ribosomal protein S14 [Candidatus Thorarchaeota archaeon]
MSTTRGERSKKRKKMGKGSRTCIRCGTHRAIIRSYGLNMCRRCFRETAEKMGFRKYR